MVRFIMRHGSIRRYLIYDNAEATHRQVSEILSKKLIKYHSTNKKHPLY